ncbi:dnaJ domain-containing protein [Sarocladium implicatum]|nr:dnaJ domain-containing protein [Sarocladium implicatum]
MGAQQSSSNADGSAAATAATPKTCYYELLGVSRDATEEEIKKAYRRKALELHPDRNLNDVESATRRFAEVQSAHEVLSDPQERAWYDDHRDAILSGQDGADGAEPTTFRNVRLTSTEEILSLMRKFNANVPFDDEPNGFYGIARETFEHLALEEDAAAEFADIDSPELPTFGSSDDDYDSVVKPFYSIWAGFSTLKSFSWKDKYRLSDAPDRRVRRLMEKENKKLRDDAIREFNDAIRFLVTFVRKRDPRYVPNTQSDADRQKSLRDAAAKQAARSRAANNEKAAAYQLPDWVQQGNAEVDAFSEVSQEEEVEVEILECVVCDKTFKSENQLGAHERSKKHQKAVHQLRRQLRREGKDLNIDPPEETESTDAAQHEEGSQADRQTSSSAESRESSHVKAHSRSGLTDSEQGSEYVVDNAMPENDAEDLEEQADTAPSSPSAAPSLGAVKLTPDTVLGDVDQQPAVVKKKVGKARLKRAKKAAAQQDSQAMESVSFI